jgi:chromosome segregation ATPase
MSLSSGSGVRTVLTLALLTAAAHSSPAAAQADKSAREHEQLRRAQLQLQQEQAQNAELQRGKSEADGKLKAATDQLDALHKDAATAQGRSQSLEAELKHNRAAQSEQSARLDELNRQLAELTQKQKETAASLAQREAEVAALNTSLAGSKNDNAACQARNEQLYQDGQTLLKAYRDKGVWSALMDREPVLGLKHVQNENMDQDYRDKLAAQRMQKP